MNKTITINPDMFKMTGRRGSRKKTDDSREKMGGIKVREKKEKETKDKRIRKQHILKFIREQQEKNYQNLVTSSDRKTSNEHSTPKLPNNDFEESIQYFSDLDKEIKTRPPSQSHNRTVRSPITGGTQLHNLPANNISINAPIEPVINTTGFDQSVNQGPMVLNSPIPTPTWGCMKNGALPTYRNWKQTTQKVMPNNHSQQTTYDKPVQIQETRHAEMKAMVSAKAEQDGGNKQPKLKYLKQKKTVRRTYNVGRSKVYSKIGVLVSNKTVRSNISTKAQLLKQTSIDDIRRDLVKKGFIRIGSNAPNDVLRKLYETTQLICGEIHNHNTDNLLYNYLNGRG